MTVAFEKDVGAAARKLSGAPVSAPAKIGPRAVNVAEASRRVGDAADVAKGALHGTLLLRIQGVTLGLVQPVASSPSARNLATRHAKADLTAEINTRHGRHQGIVFLPHNTHIRPDAEGAARMSPLRLSYEVAPDDDGQADYLEQAKRFLLAWKDRRERNLQHTKAFGAQLREDIAKSRTA